MSVLSPLLKKVQSRKRLERAWRAIQENARTSKSSDVKQEVESFTEDATARINSLSGRLAKRAFKFEPAKGVPIPKLGKDGRKSKTKFRPIVLAPLESRIVQRALLEALLDVPAIKLYAENPYSFGGIRKKDGALSAVPAAVQGVLKAIEDGASFVCSADIRSFFTRISKPSVVEIVRAGTGDDAFVSFFEKAIKVELSNMTELRERAKEFPIEDIGVAQGNSLSPLLGNIALHDFDAKMNEGEGICLRYIDDFLILANSQQVAAKKMKRAVALLAALEMELSPEKSSKAPQPINQAFEFLGIEFSNGLVRPVKKARAKLILSVKEQFNSSMRAILQHKPAEDFDRSKTVLATLKRVDGIVQGWGKHYRFCNDEICLKTIDAQIEEETRRYMGRYRTIRAERPKHANVYFGMQRLASIERAPFQWKWPTHDV